MTNFRWMRHVNGLGWPQLRIEGLKCLSRLFGFAEFALFVLLLAVACKGDGQESEALQSSVAAGIAREPGRELAPRRASEGAQSSFEGAETVDSEILVPVAEAPDDHSLQGPSLFVRLESLWPQARHEVASWQAGVGIRSGDPPISSGFRAKREISEDRVRSAAPTRASSSSKGKRRAGWQRGLRFVAGKHGSVRLELGAGGSFAGQLVRSGQGQEIRVIAPLRAETQAWLDARPKIDQLEVTHVRVGQDSVVVALRIGQKWEVAQLATTDAGAALNFRPRSW
jgi:hypothetical protein